MVTLTSDFECGNAKNVTQVSDRRFRLEIVGDKTSYNFYFCFDVRNPGAATDVEIEVRADPAFGDPSGFVVCLPTTIWVRLKGMDRFKPLDQSQVENGGDHIVIHLSLKENDEVRVTDVWPAPYSETCAFLNRLADERGDRCEPFVLGKSVQGREIPGIRAGTPGRPKVLCVAGQHAVEFTGPWGMRGVADYVTSLLPDAVALRKELEVEVIPVVNPDGNVAGRNAFNAEGFDMFQAFGDHPDAEQPEAHESRLLWRKLAEERPALWMNIHAFVGWRTNSEYPYDGWYEVIDPVFQDPDQARFYQALCDTMRLETEGLSTHGRANVHRPNTLCYQMARRFGIPSAFYEINAASAGPHGAARRAIHVFKRAADTLLHSCSASV
jgi:hypothetical protein